MQLRVKKVVQKNYDYLKTLHIELLCGNDIPYVNIMDFFNFNQKCNFPDKNLIQANIDLIFVQCDGYDPRVKNSLKRAHFIEVLMRVAKQKFVDTQIIKKMDEAIVSLIDNYIVKNIGDLEKWQKLRQELFWTLPVNDILFANLKELRSIYNFYLKREKKWMDKNECIEMMTKMFRDISVNYKIAQRCFTMSKMTLVDEY